MQLQFHLGANRARRHFADGVLLGIAGHVQMTQFRRLVRGGTHADPARQHEGRQEPEAEHADQAFIVLPALAQAPGVADAHGSQVVMDFLAGQAGTGIGDAQHAGSGIDLHRDARRYFDAGLLDAATDDRVMRVLHQLAQRHHRGGIQVLAQHRHQSIEIDPCATDFGVGGGGRGVLHVIVYSWARKDARGRLRRAGKLAQAG